MSDVYNNAATFNVLHIATVCAAAWNPDVYCSPDTSLATAIFQLELQLPEASDAQVPNGCICVMFRAVFQEVGVSLHPRRSMSGEA